jgi:hypothetical protein
MGNCGKVGGLGQGVEALRYAIARPYCAPSLDSKTRCWCAKKTGSVLNRVACRRKVTFQTPLILPELIVWVFPRVGEVCAGTAFAGRVMRNES